MLKTIAFDFIGLSLIVLCLAVVVTPGPCAHVRRRFVSDEFDAVANENPVVAVQSQGACESNAGIANGMQLSTEQEGQIETWRPISTT